LIKRRWTDEECAAFNKAFATNIAAKSNITSGQMQLAKEKFPILQSKSDAILRTRMNNLRLSKQKLPSVMSNM